MKYLIVVPDGSGDDPVEALDGKTPLEVSEIEFIDGLAARGQVGMVKTIPEGVAPGSDAANLSVMGYDPGIYLTGRSPLEAASIGVEMAEDDVAFRTNIVTLRGDGAYEDLIMEDHSSGDISTEEAAELIEAVSQAFASEQIEFHKGVSYRHCMIVHGGGIDYELTPPHDILGKATGDYLPRGDNSQFIEDMMKKSYEILKDHPVNKKRIEAGLNPGNSIWIWGQGTKPNLSSFYDKYQVTGSAISAVDLIKGIAICAGLDSVDVEGATGTLHTNFKGKTEATINEFKRGKDFVYVHLEGPDECSHQGDMEGKISCMKDIDEKVVRPICDFLEELKSETGEEYSVLIVPDHRTPLRIRTHSSDPVPYVIYRSNEQREIDTARQFNEVSGSKGRYFDSGFTMADYFFQEDK